MIPVLTEHHIRSMEEPKLEIRPFDLEDYQPVPSIARYGEVQIEVRDAGVAQAMSDALVKGKHVEVKAFGWNFRAIVVRVDREYPIFGYHEGKVRLRPTGPVMYRSDLHARAERIARTELFRAQTQMRPCPFYGEPATTYGEPVLKKPMNAITALTSALLHDEAEKIMAEAKRRLPLPCYITPKECDDYIQRNRAYAKTVGRRLADMGFGPIKEDNVDGDKKLDRKLLQANKFYVGSRTALGLPARVRGVFIDRSQPWGHKDLKGAVDHAEKLLESSEGEEQFIVKIVKIVRRKPQPVVVEDVR